VLVVEDERTIAESIAARLGAEGFAVDLAHDGPAAVSAARLLRPDLVILDIMLPGFDGLEVCRRIQAERPVPVLMLTARDDETDMLVGLAVGADDYLTKPFSFVVLLARLRALVRRGAPRRPAVLTAGDLRLDPARRRVWCGSTEVRLTPREFGVLEYLMRRGGEVVTKTEIIHAVWDPHYDGDLNVVEVYVGYLRRKLRAAVKEDGGAGRRSPIVTVRSVGYRFDATAT